MNERIRELAEQAKFMAEEDINKQISYNTELKAFAERFAELIVRECINIAYEYDNPKLSGPGLAIASNIESHFDIYIEEDGRFVK